MDSILIGFALDEIAGLPAFSYGAGLNLYNSELFGYFMNRLGAYRVDRRKKNPVYLESLKAMSNISLQWGTNTLFFPGGTRSRSGSLETRLKLGLLGTAVEAQREILKYGHSRKIYVVPLVLNYHCVLEARYLIEQHLRSIGKDAYLGSGRDEFKSFKNVFVFLYRLLSKSSEIALSFGEPMDVIGNPVNDQGISLDHKGQPIRLEDYFTSPEEDGEGGEAQRDNVYTSILAEKIVESYHQHNVVFSTNLVSYCAFKTIEHQNPSLDVFALLRLDLDDVVLEPAVLENNILEIQKVLAREEMKGNIRLDQTALLPPSECIADAINKIGVFHSIKPLKYTKIGKITSGNLKVLYFYHNRLDTYEFLKDFWK